MGSARVRLLGLVDHDGEVLKEVVDDHEAEAEVLESALDDAFFKVSIKSQDL